MLPSLDSLMSLGIQKPCVMYVAFHQALLSRNLQAQLSATTSRLKGITITIYCKTNYSTWHSPDCNSKELSHLMLVNFPAGALRDRLRAVKVDSEGVLLRSKRKTQPNHSAGTAILLRRSILRNSGRTVNANCTQCLAAAASQKGQTIHLRAVGSSS